MLVSRKFAFAVFVCSPAILLAGLAPPGAGEETPVQTNVQLAQGTEAPAVAAGAETEPLSEEEAEAAEAGSEEEIEEPAAFDEAFLDDPEHQALGKAVWETCAGCHGAKAYPGKAPKLRPSKYTADFVFDRVTNGFRKMPPWKDVFTKEERMDVVAYILSDKFSP